MVVPDRSGPSTPRMPVRCPRSRSAAPKGYRVTTDNQATQAITGRGHHTDEQMQMIER
jgi:hypothetical protein